EVELCQAIIKPTQSGKLGIERQTRVIVDFPVVFVKPERSRFKRVRRQITLDVFLRHRLIFGILGLLSQEEWSEAGRRQQKERGQCNLPQERLSGTPLATCAAKPDGEIAAQRP